jgi:hypothetical protein
MAETKDSVMKSKIAAIFALTTSLALSEAVAQGDERSLRDTDSEPGEAAEMSALAAIEKLVVENRRLKAELDDAKKTAAATTAEAEVFKRLVKEYTDRMEALGASTANPTTLEQRLLQAVNALRQSETARDTLSKALVRLAQVATEYAKKPDDEAKLVLTAELKNADEALTRAVVGEMLDKAAANAGPAPDLMNGKVSAVKPELGCVVLNLGSKHGVKVGMPFELRRGDKVVATVRVVDARQTFCGTVVQNLVSAKEPVKLGDAAKVQAQQPN